jgi:hypothetical protein
VIPCATDIGERFTNTTKFHVRTAVGDFTSATGTDALPLLRIWRKLPPLDPNDANDPDRTSRRGFTLEKCSKDKGGVWRINRRIQ